RIAVLDDILTGFRTSSPRRDLLAGETDEMVLVSVVPEKKSSRKTTGKDERKWIEHWEKRRVTGRRKHSNEILDAMKAEGWLVEWQPPEEEIPGLKPWLSDDISQGPALTLTEWAADIIGVEIGEKERGDWPRWMKAASRTYDEGDADYLLSLPYRVLPPSWNGLPPQPSRFIADVFYPFRIHENHPDDKPGPVEQAIAREEVAMREETVTHYDAEKDETTVEIVKVPAKLWEMEIPVDARLKGKRGKKRKTG